MAVSSVIDRIDRLFVDEGVEKVQATTIAALAAPKEPRVDFRRFPVVPVVSHAQEMVELDRFIDGEIRDRIGAPNMTWRKLEACFKWRALQEYMSARGITSTNAAFSQVRGLLQERQLDSVEYDASSQKIRKINHGADVCVALDTVTAAVV